MKEHANAAAIVRALYIRILSREPGPSESQAMLDFDPKSPNQRTQRKFYSGVAWPLVNSNEFVFNR
ncbi:MAG: hypothetical protein O3B13_22605 [Planctomycetota bacterium]|nr:hypothetical protein [Planctomycetota bacterium]